MSETNVRTSFPLSGTSFKHTFNFREDRKTKQKRESIEVVLAAPTASELSHILSPEQANNPELSNVRDLLLSAVYGVIISAAKTVVDDNTSFVSDDIAKYQDNINLHHIANLPKAQRGGITNAALTAFADFFKEASVDLIGINEKQAENLAGIFGERKEFAKYIGDVETRAVLDARLEAFSAAISDEQMAEHAVALTYLSETIAELNRPKHSVADL